MSGSRIVIAGGSGFLGSALIRRLRAGGHDVTLLTRRPRGAGDVAWDPSAPTGAWRSVVAEADAVVNLAGEPIESQRWTPERKAAILHSRVRATQAIVRAITGAPRAPAVLLNASAIGIYGPHAEDVVTEATPAGTDFLAQLCVAWEREAAPASARSRVVLLRTGLVLDRDAGALPRMAMPFHFFVGGPLGSGRQYWSWIHVDDWVSMVLWALEDGSAAGPINITAPTPVTNREFASTLGRVLKRPALLPAPGFALRIALGEMADALILSGQRVLPARALASGFRFQHEGLEQALRALYR